MKWPGLLLIVSAQCAQAGEPSGAVIHSCLRSHAIVSNVTVTVLRNDKTYEEADYSAGYDASYFFKAAGRDVRYGTKGTTNALLYESKFYPLEQAKPLLHSPVPIDEFNPYLAEWSVVKEKRAQFLCVNLNFDGIGRSGSFQNVDGAFLLPMGLGKMPNRLFYAVTNIKLPPGSYPKHAPAE